MKRISVPISAYLGKDGSFANALAVYAHDYAYQVQRDFEAFRAGCHKGADRVNRVGLPRRFQPVAIPGKVRGPCRYNRLAMSAPTTKAFPWCAMAARRLAPVPVGMT
jgi:hypothetical protein